MHQANCRHVFNYFVYLHSFTWFLVGLLPMWALWDCCLPAHHPKSSQGRVPLWEYTKHFSVIKEPVLSLLRSDGVFTDILSLLAKWASPRVSPRPSSPLKSVDPSCGSGLRIFWIDSTALPTKLHISVPVFRPYFFSKLVKREIRQIYRWPLFVTNWTTFVMFVHI